MFSTIEVPVDPKIQAANAANVFLQQANKLHQYVFAEFANQWRDFWSKDISLEQMQARIDILAESGDLLPYMGLASGLHDILKAFDADSFKNARTDKTGQCTEFSGAGYTYRMEGERMVLLAPCEWVEKT